MQFSREIRISFDQCDPAGILFFANLFNLTHQAIEAWTHSTKFKWENWFNSTEWGVPLVHANANYKAPLLAGKSYNQVLKTKSIGNSSITFLCQYIQNNQVLCETETTHVFVDLKSHKSVAIPEIIKNEVYQSQKIIV